MNVVPNEWNHDYKMYDEYDAFLYYNSRTHPKFGTNFMDHLIFFKLWSWNYFSNFGTPFIYNTINTGTKYFTVLNKLQFKEKKRKVYTMLKIFSIYIY